MNARIAYVSLACLLFSACSDTPAPAAEDLGLTSDITPMEDMGSTEEDSGVDTPSEDADEDITECRTLGCACDQDSDCNADFCARHPDGGQVCSEFCVEDCSEEGYECRTLRDGRGDLVRYCVPVGDPYCTPCEIDADCLATDNLCLELADGDFCATGCGDGEPCPEGASCIGVVVGSEDVLVCAPDGNQCATCIDGDGDGRGVGPDCLGLDCNDDNPAIFEDAPEACDGLDNDCDDSTDEDFTTLGEACGTCDSGTIECADLVAACVGDLGDAALNDCGGCEVLEGSVGDACGDCGRGSLVCGEEGLECEGDSTNECGGCADLENPLEGLCDSGCGAGSWACSASGEATFCDAEGANACGGCATLAAPVGEACAGTCGEGAWACVDGAPNEVYCEDGIELNPCGGCATLADEPLDPCGPCGLDLYECDGTEAVVCTGETPANTCGGCGLLDGSLGDACGPCAAVLECDGTEAYACVGDLTDSDADTVCDIDDVCPDGDDRVDSDDNGIPDDCDGECTVASECGEDSTTAWGTCEGFADTCDESGTRERTRTTYSCTEGVCSVDVAAESEACTRSTVGTTCGADLEYSDWSTCGDFDSACDESGTRTRTRTDYSCSGGGCVGVDTEESEACERVTGGTTCGAGTDYTGWSACGGFSSTCDQSGTRSRVRTDYMCSGGGCAGVATTETEACSRSTGGATCGSGTTYTTWSSCGGFSSSCDETGTRTRTRTDYTCSSGGCGGSSTVETEACGRPTDGASCGDGTVYGSWGACGGFWTICQEFGSRSRSVTSYTCDGGACAPSVSSQDEDCSRETDGISCDDDSYTSWGACGGFGTTCDESGTRSRTRTAYECSDSACSPSSSVVEDESCSRDTDGTTCEETEYSAWSTCSYADQCEELGRRTRTRTDYTCDDGSCRSGSSPQNDTCPRDTDGNFCTDWEGCRFTTCSGGVCPSGPGCAGGRRCCEPGICAGAGDCP